VQEALTNTSKHGNGGPVQIRVDYRPTEVVITVVNEPVERSAAPSLPGSGHGLTGLRERVTLAGGELVVGPLAEGAWEVRATLPDAPVGVRSGDRTGREPPK
jgi:signal transduction histidine kinase